MELEFVFDNFDFDIINNYCAIICYEILSNASCC